MSYRRREGYARRIQIIGQMVNAVGENKAKEEGPGRRVSKRPGPQHGNTCGYCTVGVRRYDCAVGTTGLEVESIIPPIDSNAIKSQRRLRGVGDEFDEDGQTKDAPAAVRHIEHRSKIGRSLDVVGGKSKEKEAEDEEQALKI
ncbi:hypothetical protein C8J57DRAFT_1220871 [Mycena rebaudengoi]|nr:hypothetical protein C8J57DRAFT_1220871 [Mycena rebaudengoi]